MRIVGVSFDEPADNAAWREDEGFPYELWTDDDRSLALTYGAAVSASAAVPSRVTVLLDENGDLMLNYAVRDIGTHPASVLADCEALFGE